MMRMWIVTFLWFSGLFADWNAHFTQESQDVCHVFPSLCTSWHEEYYTFFLHVKDAILKDSKIRKRYRHCALADKFQVRDEKRGIIIKKRPQNRIKEFYVWELASLLHTEECIVPAFPIDIQGTKVIIQAMEEFFIGHGKTYMPDEALLQRISLITYWRAHLTAYLLGLGDLVGINIGVNAHGYIRFFDTESCLHYQNIPKRASSYFHVGFVMESFDWPHYRQPLHARDAALLRSLIASWSHLEEKITLYAKLRNVSLGEGFWERLHRVRSFVIQEGVSFRDFYGSLFARMDPGLDELNEIVSAILQREVDHGAALFFASRRRERMQLSQEMQQALDRWMTLYIGE